MRTLKFKPQPTVTFFCCRQSNFRRFPITAERVALTWKGESAVGQHGGRISLTTQSPTTQLQSFSEDSVFEDVSIELPDLEETQI